MTTSRKATDAELIEAVQYYVSRNLRMRFRHFIKEMYAPGRKHGVRHVSHSKRVPFIRDGQVFVHFQGRDQKLTGSHVTFDTIRPVVCDIRIDSEYLKSQV